MPKVKRPTVSITKSELMELIATIHPFQDRHLEFASLSLKQALERIHNDAPHLHQRLIAEFSE